MKGQTFPFNLWSLLITVTVKIYNLFSIGLFRGNLHLKFIGVLQPKVIQVSLRMFSKKVIRPEMTLCFFWR